MPAQTYFEFLARASEALASSLDYEQTLRDVAALVLPTLGDLCIVDVVEDNRLRRVATTHVSPEKRQLLDLLLNYPASATSPQPTGRVLRSGRPELLAEVTPEIVASHTINAEHAALILAIGIRSNLAVPLVARGATVGVITLGITESDRRYTEADVTLAEDLARRAALAVDNARLYLAAQTELAERRRAEEALRLSEQRFRAIMEQSPLSIQLFHPNGDVFSVNKAWEELWGVTLDRIPEYNVLEDPQLAALGIAPLLQRAFAGEAVALPAVRYDPDATLPNRTRHEDAVRWVRAFAYPVKDLAGTVCEVVLVHEDVTNARNAQEKLRASEERLRLALAAGRMNAWEWDLATDRLECSDNAEEFWGVASGPSSAFMRAVHPEDVATVEEAARAAMEGAGPYVCEYRLVCPDEQVRWVQSRGRVERRNGGRPQQIVGVTVDITEMKAAEATTRRLYDQLREEDRRKDEFLATLAHELRNPLAPIRTGLALMRAGTDRASFDRTREIMERQVGHMVHLIDDLLDLSRITRGQIQLERERVDLWTIVGAALETSRPLIDAAGLQLVVRMPGEPVVLDVDRMRIAQVLSNLLNNAAKYTDPGGRIELDAAVEDGEVVIRVSDTGIGIPPEMLGRVFEMFSQVQHAVTRSQGGLGIGLTLVQRLVELHGGQVRAESDGPGHGSRFVVQLRAAAAMTPEGEVSADIDGTHVPPLPCRILIVDDNTDAADTLALLLRLHGHEVETAGSGADALDVVRQFTPDIAFLDIGLPGMSGYELARKLRADERLVRTTLAAVTGWGQAEDRRQSREAGFDHHLTKPVDPRQVLALVRSVLPPEDVDQ